MYVEFYEADQRMTRRATITFALRTDDAAWIERNHGITDPENGRIFVQVPAGQVERHTFAGVPMLRHVFADVPADALNAAYGCPEAWVATRAAQHPEG